MMKKMNVKLIIRIFFLLLIVVPRIAYAKEFIVVIDPGHGGRDPGAIGAVVKEKNINLSVALKLGSLIEQRHSDVRVLYTRKKDYFIELDQRANIANNANADLFISIHANAISNKNFSGAETFTLGLARTKENLEVAKRENAVILLEDDYKQKYEGFDPNSTESYIMIEFMQNKYLEQSIDFASYIQKELQSSARRKDRGVKQAGFLVLRKTSMPSVLIELGFISNLEEENYMRSDNGQRNLSESIYRAFRAYKNDHDRKSGYASNGSAKAAREQIPDIQPIAAQTKRDESASPESLNVKPASVEPQKQEPVVMQPEPKTASGLVYKIQILTSSSKLPANSPKLKGYANTGCYAANGSYKYTYGEYESEEAANAERRRVLNDFKDAFVVVFKDGVRIK
jgi:N-acetylmuramoyl-L-alanine amidase